MPTKTVYAADSGVKRTEAPYWPVHEVLVDYTQNTTRSCIYRTPDGTAPCCFALSDALDIMLTLPTRGQEQPIVVNLNGRGEPIVSKGYRRRYVYDLLEMAASGESLDKIGGMPVFDDGQLDALLDMSDSELSAALAIPKGGKKADRLKAQRVSDTKYVAVLLHRFARDPKGLASIPGSRGGRIWCAKKKQPDSPEARYDDAVANLAENSKLRPSPLDIAYACRRFAADASDNGEFGKGNAEAGRLVGMMITGQVIGERSVAQYRQLLTLTMAEQGQVHRYEMSMAAALRLANREARGRAGRKRPGVKHTAIRSGIDSGTLWEALQSQGTFAPSDVRDVLAFVSGHSTDSPDWWPTTTA